jgi:putative membrane protein
VGALFQPQQEIQMKLSRLNTILAAALFGGALTLPAFAQQDTQPAQSGQSAQQSGQQGGAQHSAQGKLSSADHKFLMEAAQGGMAEVEASRLAMERASSQNVKQFAQQLMKDHTDANEKLMQIAQDKGVQLPKQLQGHHKQMIDRLSKLNGQEFDREYMREMGLKDHKKDIQQFEKQARQGKDPELKTFAEETLPVLQKHLSMAQKVSGGAESAEKGGGSSSGSAASSDGNRNKQ